MQKRIQAIALLALSAAIAGVDESKVIAFPKIGPKGPPLVVKDITHPDVGVSAAIEDLQRRVAAEDRPFVRYFWWGATPDDRLIGDITNWRAYLQTVSSEALVFPRPVPGTNLRLWAFDIRDARWTRAGFANIVAKDKVFREPHVDHTLAETLRRLSGIGQNRETFHAEVIVPGPWFLRQIMDVDGVVTTAYYDLLYSAERFGADGKIVPVVPSPIATVIPPEPVKPAERPWPGGYWPPGSKAGDAGALYYAAGAFPWTPKKELEAYEAVHAEWTKLKNASVAKPAKEVYPPGDVVKAKVIKDFPENLQQFEDKWGTTANKAFLDSQKIFVNNGEVVAGGKSIKNKPSYVSYQDRVIRFYDGPFNNGAMNMSTQDFLRTSGRKNPANLPLETALGLLEEDAGEHLSGLPNGFQAALLTGAAGAGRKRVEFGDTRLVHSSLDPSDVTIRTQFSCVICHGRQEGVISPSNRKVRETMMRGVELFVKGKQNQLVVRNFFDEVEWKLEIGRVAYRRGLEKSTQWPDAPGWSGTQWSEATISFRDWYDAPVTLNQAAAELGYPVVIVMAALLAEGSIDAGNLFMDGEIPRTVWDDDLFERVALLIAFTRDFSDPDPLLWLFMQQLRLDALKQVEAEKAVR